jgi:hypothetical protein
MARGEEKANDEKAKDVKPWTIVWGDRLGDVEIVLWILIGVVTLALWLKG